MKNFNQNLEMSMAIKQKTIRPVVYETTIVSDRLGLIGNQILFEDSMFFGLSVGDKVTQIGDGRQNSCARTDFFNRPLEYVGFVFCGFGNKKEIMFAFNTGELYKDENIYLLYGSTGKEIFTEGVYSRKRKESYVRFYHASFTNKT